MLCTLSAYTFLQIQYSSPSVLRIISEYGATKSQVKIKHTYTHKTSNKSVIFPTYHTPTNKANTLFLTKDFSRFITCIEQGQTLSFSSLTLPFLFRQKASFKPFTANLSVLGCSAGGFRPTLPFLGGQPWGERHRWVAMLAKLRPQVWGHSLIAWLCPCCTVPPSTTLQEGRKGTEASVLQHHYASILGTKSPFLLKTWAPILEG